MKSLMLAGDSWTYIWNDDISDLEMSLELKAFSTPNSGTKHAIRYQELLYSGYGFNTLNVGCPGGDNEKAINTLAQSLQLHPGTDYVIYYFTESVRGAILTSSPPPKLERLAHALHNKEEFFETLTDFCVADLVSLADTIRLNLHRCPNIQVLLIGGQEKITPDMMECMREEVPEVADRIHLVMDSAMEFLLKLYNPKHFDALDLQEINYSHFFEDFRNVVSESTNEAIVDQLLENTSKRVKVKETTPFVWPDTGWHANALGQFYIFNEVIKKITELEKN